MLSLVVHCVSVTLAGATVEPQCLKERFVQHQQAPGNAAPDWESCCSLWVSLLFERYLSNTTSCVCYGITCLIRLIQFAALFTTLEERVCWTTSVRQVVPPEVSARPRRHQSNARRNVKGSLYIYIYIYTYIYTHMYTYTYTYIRTHTYTHI